MRLHIRDTGPRDGPAVLLIHGFGSSLHTWEAWAPLLEQIDDPPPLQIADDRAVALTLRQHRGQDLQGHLAPQQPVAVLGEGRGVPHWVYDRGPRCSAQSNVRASFRYPSFAQSADLASASFGSSHSLRVRSAKTRAAPGAICRYCNAAETASSRRPRNASDTITTQ